MSGLFRGLLDDAAIFPPGNLPLAEAVPAHRHHRETTYADLVGPLVLSAASLGELGPLVADPAAGSLPVSVTVPLPRLAAALEAVEAIPAARLRGVEVALPEEAAVAEVVPAITSTGVLDATDAVWVEVPRDGRREPLLDALAEGDLRAKFRTGGVRAELYPDEAELAAAVLGVVRRRVRFKATAGLHHALRNTDPRTGFEQHGFLNLLNATAAAVAGAEHGDLVELLAERDPDRVAEAARLLGGSVRDSFASFGTCSVTEPVAELSGLGLIDLTKEPV